LAAPGSVPFRGAAWACPGRGRGERRAGTDRGRLR
jgi:hypothetical protein